MEVFDVVLHRPLEISQKQGEKGNVSMKLVSLLVNNYGLAINFETHWKKNFDAKFFNVTLIFLAAYYGGYYRGTFLFYKSFQSGWKHFPCKHLLKVNKKNTRKSCFHC